MSEKKCIHRPIPCPEYNIEAMQCWLEDMAKEGYILSEDGFFMGFASFEVGAPQNLRYRLEPIPKDAGFMNDHNTPNSEAAEMNEAFGWRYIARRGQFYIYCASDPSAPELNTDPQIQEISLKALNKRMRSSLLWSIFFGLLCGWLSIGFMLVICAAFVGTGKILVGMAVVLLTLVERLISVVRLNRMRKRLLQGQMLTQRVDYWKGRLPYWIGKIAGTVVPIVWLVLIISSSPNQEVLINEYEGTFPFATVQEIFPEAQVEYDGTIVDSTVSVYSDVLIPETYEYSSNVDLFFPDGSSSWGNFYVNYHRTASPWLAKRMAREYELHYNRQNSIFSGNGKTEIPITGIEADYLSCYTEGIGNILILCKGNEIVRCVYQIYGHDTDSDMQHFAQVMADSIS